MPEANIQVGGGRPKRKKINRRLVAILAGVLVLGVLAGLGFRWWQQYNVDQENKATEELTKKVEETQALALSGKYDEAQKAIADELAKPDLKQDAKYVLLLQQGVNYSNKKKYDDAIKSYQAAQAIKDTSEVAEAVARTAEYKGDKAMAIEYYKKAIGLLVPGDVMADGMKTFYEERIKSLGGQP